VQVGSGGGLGVLCSEHRLFVGEGSRAKPPRKELYAL